jgi:hypothetical protein
VDIENPPEYAVSATILDLADAAEKWVCHQESKSVAVINAAKWVDEALSDR